MSLSTDKNSSKHITMIGKPCLKVFITYNGKSVDFKRSGTAAVQNGNLSKILFIHINIILLTILSHTDVTASCIF
jgi:hypothetical protein